MWDVAEWMKQRYMETGKIPTDEEVAVEFAGEIPVDELLAGVREFWKVVRIYVG